MNLRRSLRPVAVLAGAALVTTSLIAPATAAPSQSTPSASWLAGELNEDGLLTSFGFPDYGLSIDALTSFRSLGVEPAAQSAILEALRDDHLAYTDYEYDPDSFPGPDGPCEAPDAGEENGNKEGGLRGVASNATAKLTAAVVATAGEDVNDFGGTDLEQKLEGLVEAGDGPSLGRIADVNEAAGPDPACEEAAANAGDFANTIGQSFAATALAASGSDLADEAEAFLLAQQCEEGFFRLSMAAGDGSFTCDGDEDASASVDATALAVQALIAIGADPTALDNALDWLEGAQNADGSFSDAGVPNANSTGLAAVALIGNRNEAAAAAAAWVAGQQAIGCNLFNSPLAADIGAIAFDKAALAAGKTDGITAQTRDQYRRATAQSLLALQEREILDVRSPRAFAKAGSTIQLVLRDLDAGEQFDVSVRGNSVASGTAGDTAVTKVTVEVPAGTRAQCFEVTGAANGAVGSVAIQGFDKKNLGLTLAKKSVKKKGTQRVTVSRLVAGEDVVVKYAGKTVAQGTARKDGTFRASFKVGTSKGNKSVRVTGQYVNRQNVKSFKVT